MQCKKYVVHTGHITVTLEKQACISGKSNDMVHEKRDP